ncbi:hypothetical protein BDV09DRAFT_58925 [Aspergillus tetrazonus]
MPEIFSTWSTFYSLQWVPIGYTLILYRSLQKALVWPLEVTFPRTARNTHPITAERQRQSIGFDESEEHAGTRDRKIFDNQKNKRATILSTTPQSITNMKERILAMPTSVSFSF